MKADLRSARVLCAVFAVLLVAGCAAMPSDGPPERVDVPQGAGAENLQVRVFPVPPHKGEDPLDLLAGFLDASNADEVKNYDTARKYLTADADKRWNPEAGVVVLAATPRRDTAVRGPTAPRSRSAAPRWPSSTRPARTGSPPTPRTSRSSPS
ncbi:hypothetical protein GCM10025734_35110 [Kitasatospora paranensis]|uniref:hypothetical protein n=1 Tax=Kitasatospora paranensis TaxID=258053 RepID=UPI0031EE3D90